MDSVFRAELNHNKRNLVFGPGISLFTLLMYAFTYSLGTLSPTIRSPLTKARPQQLLTPACAIRPQQGKDPRLSGKAAERWLNKFGTKALLRGMVLIFIISRQLLEGGKTS